MDALWTLASGSLRPGTLSLTDQHKEMLTAMYLCDAEKAAEAILADVKQGIDQIKSSMLGN